MHVNDAVTYDVGSRNLGKNARRVWVFTVPGLYSLCVDSVSTMPLTAFVAAMDHIVDNSLLMMGNGDGRFSQLKSRSTDGLFVGDY